VVEQGDDELARDAPLQQPHLLHHVQAVGHHLRQRRDGCAAAGIGHGTQQQGNGTASCPGRQLFSTSPNQCSCLGGGCMAQQPRPLRGVFAVDGPAHQPAVAKHA